MLNDLRAWAPLLLLGAALAFIGVTTVTRNDPVGPVVGELEVPSGHEPAMAREPIAPVPDPPVLDEGKVELGRRLFHDPRLSGDGSVSCASCHDLSGGGDDGMPYSTGAGGVLGRRNSPTVLNSALNFRQFWDGRAETLFEQVEGPLLDPLEMGSTWEHVLNEIRSDEGYVASFRATYGGISRTAVMDAIATFEQTLLTPNAPFDLYLRGDADAVDEDVLRGYALFKDLGCIACHQGVNVGGNMFQRFGAMREDDPDDDLGRFEVTQRDVDRHRFKVPTLRNVALTAPYFHDGSAETLDEAVREMALAQLGTTLEDEEVRLLVAFLESLTGELPD